jgi:hypothetical protein
MPATTPRPFSTATQVHPGYLPALHKSRRVEKKLAVAAITAAGIGYGMSKYRQHQDGQRLAQELSEAATRKRSETMMDAYGDRGSLEALEAAVRMYEAQQAR